MGKNYKKYLRRVAAASVCAVALCLAVMVSATYALFQIDVFNEGNTIEVGSFTADASIVAVTENAEQTPATYASGDVCPEGKYTLNINWSGNIDGHIKVAVTSVPNGGAALLSVGDETAEAPAAAVYAIDLPVASSISFMNESGVFSDTLQIPLTVHEPSQVIVEASWGEYIPAEGEAVSPITMEKLGEFITTGISSGTPFESSVTVRKVETESEESSDEENTEETKPEAELIGADMKEAKDYDVARYILTVNWTSKFDAYCVLDIAAADAESGIESQKFFIKLPADPGDEDGVSQLTFPVRICDKAKITASVVKGSTDSAILWPDGAGVVFGTFFEADVTVDQLPVTSDVELTALDPKKTYPVGDYQLKLDWTHATADGYSIITVGEDVWYYPGSVAADTDAEKSYAFMLKLLKDAKVSVEFRKGTLPEGAAVLSAETITYGAEFKAEASIGAVPAEGEPVYGVLTSETYAAGPYQLKLTWADASADGYCVLSVGEELYYVSCPVDAKSCERIITLELMKDAAVTVLTHAGAIPADHTALTADRIICGAVFEGTASIAAVPAEGEAVYQPIGEDLYAVGKYRLSLDWKDSNVDGYILITVTVPAANEDETAAVVCYWMSGAVTEKTRVLELDLAAEATVQVDFVEGTFSGDAYAVPSDGKISAPVSAVQPVDGDQE